MLIYEFDYELLMGFGVRTDLVLTPGSINTYNLYRLGQFFVTSLN